MAIATLGQAVEHGPRDGTAKLVLLALCNFANANGECWPSIETLVRISSCHRATVFRKLKQLEKDRWITRVPRAKGSGATAVSNYIINLQKLHEAHAKYLAERGWFREQTPDQAEALGGVAPSDGGGRTETRGGSHKATPRGSPPATLTFKNQEYEPSGAPTPARPQAEISPKLQLAASLATDDVQEALELLRLPETPRPEKDQIKAWLQQHHAAVMAHVTAHGSHDAALLKQGSE